MAAYVHQPYHSWSQEEPSEQNDYDEAPTPIILDHGSISFGRYACEQISWEKRSVFNFNRQQEELEKFKSHGLVSKKKAYFEEYYKNIRAMKALENQHSEIALDYSNVGSSKCQVKEEEVPSDSTVVVEMRREEAEALGGLTMSDFDSSNNSVAGKQQCEVITTCAKNLEVDTSVDQLSEVSIEETKQQIDVCPVEGKEASSDIILDYSHVGSNISQIEEIPAESSIKVVDKCREEAEAPCRLESSDFDSSSNSSVIDKVVSVNQALEISVEEAKHIDVFSLEFKEAPRENKSSTSKAEHEFTTKESKSVVEKTSSSNVMMKLDHGTLVPRKAARAVRKHKDTTSTTKLKEPTAPARTGLKLENKAKLVNEKSTSAPKIIKKTDVKLVNGMASSKKIAEKVPKDNKSTAAVRPFSSATNKRATKSSQGRELCSKTSTMKMSLTVQGKEPINALNTSKKIAAVKSIRSTVTEEKRVDKDIKIPASMKVENRASLKERDANVPGASKNRQPRPCGSRPGTAVPSHNARKNPEQEHLNNLQQTRPCGSRPGFGGQSQNARKNLELEEKPRWR